MTKHLSLIAFCLILLLAAFLRLYRLDQLPPGLHFDEAFKTVEARQILAGNERSLFFTENFTEEPMMMYATALSFALFGASPWALHLVSAVAGVLTVAALYLLARELFLVSGSPPLAHITALLAAFILAILYWHLNFSRLGMEPVLTPLMLTLTVAFLWRAIRTPTPTATPIPSSVRDRGWAWALAGFFLGATQYTYKAALFVPLLGVLFLVVEFIADRDFVIRHMRGLAILVIVAVLVFAPLGLYFVTHPAEFLERPSTVTTFEPTTIAANAARVAGMFFVQGDDNPRSNLPGRAALDPFLAIGFVAGVIACVVRFRRREARLLLLWLVVMALPSVLSDFAPHFGRDIGVTPALALITACGFGAIIQTVQNRHRLLIAAYGLLLAGLLFSTYSTVVDYFSVWGGRTGLFDSFDVGYLSLAEKLGSRPANESIYLSPVSAGHYTIQFGLNGREARSFDGRNVLVLPAPGTNAIYGIVTREDARSLARLQRIFPDGRVIDAIGDWTGAPYASLFRVEGIPHIAPQQLVHARLNDAIELIGYDVARTDNAIALTVYWGSIAETRSDYTVFAHLVGGMNPETQSPVWSQDDTAPGRGLYPTSRWQAGEVIVDDYRLALPSQLPHGEYQIEVGMYLAKTGARIPVNDANGAPMENDRVLFQRIALP